jgi:hypothetical protein
MYGATINELQVKVAIQDKTDAIFYLQAYSLLFACLFSSYLKYCSFDIKQQLINQ